MQPIYLFTYRPRNDDDNRVDDEVEGGAGQSEVGPLFISKYVAICRHMWACGCG